MARAARKTASLPEFPTDEELGIGVEDEAPADPLAALMSDPRMAALLDAAVAARIAQMGVPAANNGGLASETLIAFTETIKHLITTQAQQQPGYIKPLPPDEVDRRAAGYIEMMALLEECEREGKPPAWIVGDNGFFECSNAVEYKPGDKIRMYLPPPEDFVPNNERAEKVHDAMMKYLGGPTPEIGEQVKQAQIDAKQGPLITGALQPARRPTGPVELVEAAPAAPPPSRKRVMGSIVPERRDVSTAERLATGPTFLGADAA